MTSVASLWNRHVVPWAVETCCSGSSIERQRQKVVPRARGRVLEVGVGSGLNLAHYGAEVREVIGIDPSPELLVKARARTREVEFHVELREGSAERLLHDDESFDTVVTTYTLCSIPDVRAALREIRRVLRPEGLFLLSEHGLAPDASPARWQRRLNPAWKRLGGGCHLDRDIPALLAQTGFDVDALESTYLPGPRWLNWHTFGAAGVGNRG